MKIELATVISVVGAFAAKNRGVEAGSVKAETPLFRDGLIDSFALMDLIGELERLLGTTLPDGALIPEDFETPNALFERLLQL